MALALVQQQITMGLNQQAIEEWQEYRTEKKKPLSQLALKKTTNLMLKYPEAQQQLMVDAAIMNDWQGLHPVEVKNNETGFRRNTGTYQRKLTPAERGRALRDEARQRELAAGSPTTGALDTNVRNVWPPVGQPAR